MATTDIQARVNTRLARLGLVFLALTLARPALAQREHRSHRPSSSDEKRSIKVGNLERYYLLHVPQSLPQGTAAPLVLVFHGGGGHARNMPRFTGFDRLADAQGFVVAYPDSYNKSWNDTRGLSPADDVGFIRALIDELSRSYPIDAKRVYATGISNGGFFSQRLACDLTDKLAAVASVAATMPESLVPVCRPSRPISVMFIQGTDDPLVHIDGGAILKDRGRNIPLTDAVKFWRSWDRTSDTPASEDLPDRDPGDGTRIHRDVYSGGKQRTEVMVYIIKGGGHTWPGGSQYLPVFLIGRASRDLDATDVIWRFFKEQVLP
jgi:polyhydroxybutyrate depolymerase